MLFSLWKSIDLLIELRTEKKTEEHYDDTNDNEE